MSSAPGRVMLSRASLMVVVALYAVVLLGGPFEHHDFACHQSSRTHCTSCTSSQFASGVESGGVPDASRLEASGRLESLPPLTVDLLLPARTTGRSPPA